MDKAPLQPRTVAVVGSGMAGLVTAHLLHQDTQRRFRVTLLEKVS
jgi:2-polyprenyl-6-methoxyphenol hydroxylase-like FAD-dependent oxidoreductase